MYFCNACCLGKIHKFLFPISETVYDSPLQLIHSDLWGPAPIVSSNEYKYYIHFIDAYSRYTWVYLLKAKSKALQTFINFKTQVENEFNCKIKAFQSDWGVEFRTFASYLTTHGISHRLSCPTTHQQNGVAERKHRHLVESALTFISQCLNANSVLG